MLEDVKVAPSVLSADFSHLADELGDIASADLIHYDVMDGHFVPNLSFGPSILSQVKETSDLPVDVHLMVSNPDQTADLYLDAGADMVGFHVEAATHAHRLISHIHDRGAKATITLNPATPICAIEEIICDVDMILVMSVNPGFGGQSFIDATYDKLRRLKALCQERGCSPMIEVDGGISAANAEAVCAAGANVLVAGSAVFGQTDRAASIAAIRQAGLSGLTRKA